MITVVIVMFNNSISIDAGIYVIKIIADGGDVTIISVLIFIHESDYE